MQIEQRLTFPPACTDPIFSLPQLQNFLAQAHHVLLCAQGGGHLLGRATAGATADILTLFVPPEARRQGRAAALLQAFLAHAKAQGATGLALEVRADNAAAIALYTKLGLVAQHRRVGYYGAHQDALVLAVNFP
jgi:ribosomal protein S18 acetylase RimI-like enzyme